ncbi:MAG: hypothetical protein GY787_29440 [Alteromonadales bacterium]|nr:hypothetical protein [Alteromonadales bacterium]
MAILVIHLPHSILEEMSTNPDGEGGRIKQEILKASEYYHETGELTLILPVEEGYGTVYEGEGKITDFKIEAAPHTPH